MRQDRDPYAVTEASRSQNDDHIRGITDDCLPALAGPQQEIEIE